MWPISYRVTAHLREASARRTDGEYDDARQAQFGATLRDFWAELKRQDYFERGVAATRAALTFD